FSTIPSFFVDNATLFHGTSSVNETGAGLGGMGKLSTAPIQAKGAALQYVQGIGSFRTFDEFLRFSYGNKHWSFSTRTVYSSSPNDYKYVNHDKKVNIYDDEKNIIGQYHPTERNRSGAYKDLHILQEVYYNTLKGDRFALNAWYINSNRELPMLTTDYGDERQFENRQREHTLRALLSWMHTRSTWKTDLSAGYIHTWMAYDYKREITEGNWASMTRSRSKVNTVFGKANGEYAPDNKWFFTANITAHQYFVRSEDKNIILQDGNRGIVGYDKARIELSASASAKWQPIEPIGISAVLRQEMFGNRWAPVIPALFVDGLLSSKGNIMLKASISKNHKFPTLNALYFLPGGNPDLKSESGFTYDAGATFRFDGSAPCPFKIGGSATWFDSYIRDWIIWLPTTKGFFSPRNVKQVHAYGVEGKLNIALQPFKNWIIDFSGSYSWTPSINNGEKMSPSDQSVGKQLPYVPKHSASFTARLSWTSWSLLYKWAYYSERYTMSSNDYTITGHLPQYFMSNISLEKSIAVRFADLQLKLAVNNLFNEEYLSVLSRPMPGINFEFFIAVTPRW
ncbi:MAG: TonB-dependent receptor, partial [Muribaculaceae bacterium]|nr:TonB-dependent receptor [Muribaculaceae bacterium]